MYMVGLIKECLKDLFLSHSMGLCLFLYGILFLEIKIMLVPKNSACPKTAIVRKKAQKCDFMAEKGARMAPKDVNRRILASFDAFWRIGKKHSVL